MENPSGVRRRRLPKILRVMRARPRVFLAALFGGVLGLLLPPEWRVSARALVGWDAGVAFYLISTFPLLVRSDAAAASLFPAAKTPIIGISSTSRW